MIKVLVITSILPIGEVKGKRNENDILLVTEDEIKKKHPHFSFDYLFVFPQANFLLGLLSKKWKSYYELGKKERTISKSKNINLLSLIMLPKKLCFRRYLYDISVRLNRKYIDRLIKDIKPTIIHAQDIESNAYLAKIISREYNIPYIITLRGGTRMIDNFHIENIKGAESLIAISPLQKTIFQKVSSNPISLIPHGIPEKFFADEIKNYTNKPLKLIVVCRLLESKNIDKVIIALSRINEEYHFDIFGDGPEEARLRKLIINLGLSSKIKLKGRVENEIVPSILKKYDLFVMPSFPETFGRVFIEAMASGLPVIGAKSSGIDGIITHMKEGFLIQPSTNEIEAILKEILRNPEQLIEMKSSALQLSKDFFWENIVEKYNVLYSGL